MSKRFQILGAILTVALLVGASAMSYADVSIPETPINDILSHQSSLGLTETQVEKLNKFNRGIIDKIIQVKAQAQIRKQEIDQFSSDWSKVHGTATDRLIKEYYDLLADLKQLELEAIMKARGVLTIQQMRRYTEISNIEAMMIKLDNSVASAH